MSPFSFLLSHTLTVFLSIFRTAPPTEALSFLCFALSGTHIQKWPRKALSFSFAHKVEWPLFSFFSSFVSFSVSHTPKSVPKKNGMLTLEHFSLREVRPLHVLVTSQ